MVVEVYTIGGGEYIVNTFNAVAAWTGEGGYKSLLQVVLVMGLIMAMLVLAFSADWRSLINWFLQGTLMYACLMVPRVDVQVVDRVNAGLAPSYVANVPLGLGMVASFTSQVGDYLTREAEVVFGLPTELQYSTNGMVYGARLIDAAQGMYINDPAFATNLDEHLRNCTFYDILLGHKTMSWLANSTDLWASLGPGSPSHAQKYISDDSNRQDGTTEILTCKDAYDRLSQDWTNSETWAATVLAEALYPGHSGPDDAALRAKLFADLGSSYTYLTGVSADGATAFKQTLLLNAFTQAMHGFAASSGSSSIDVYAQTRAEIQTRNTYASLGTAAQKWVPILQIVLTTLFYALFPIIFPLFLLSTGGMTALKGYVTGFFYLASWGPLFAILHMIMMLKGGHDISGASFGAFNNHSVNLASEGSIGDAAGDISVLAGYLMASVPFLAGGIARGAMAISSNATSFLAPSQAAAEIAAGEASTGNISLGNTTVDNQSMNNRQANNWSSLGSFTSGVPAFHSQQPDGTMVNSFGSSTVVDSSPAISRLGVTPTLSDDYQAAFTRSATEAKTRSESLAHTASDLFSTANGQVAEFRNAMSAGSSLERGLGSDDRSTIGTTFSEIDNAATQLQNRFGFNRSAAESYATESMFTGRINTGIGSGGRGGGAGGGGLAGALNAGAGVETSRSQRSGSSGQLGADDSLSKAQDFLTQNGRSRSWGTTKDAFDRVTQSSSNSELASRSQAITASFSRATSTANEARTAFDQSQRYEEAASLRDTHGVSVAGNLSQQFLEYTLGEQRKLAAGGIASTWNPTRGIAHSAEEQAEQAFYVRGFIAAEQGRIAAGVEPSLVAPTAAGLTYPSANTQSKVRAIGDGAIADVGSHALPTSPNVVSAATNYRINRARVEAVEAGGAAIGAKVDARDHAFRQVTPTLSPEPATTIHHVIGDKPNGFEALGDGIGEIFKKR